MPASWMEPLIKHLYHLAAIFFIIIIIIIYILRPHTVPFPCASGLNDPGVYNAFRQIEVAGINYSIANMLNVKVFVVFFVFCVCRGSVLMTLGDVPLLQATDAQG